MLVLRNIPDESNIIESYYKSSNILYSSYDTHTNQLSVIFNSGKQYQYDDVPLKEFLKFEKDDSQGKYFNKNISKTYPYSKKENVDVGRVVEELNKVASQAGEEG
jgi:type III secretory pathway component EscR